MRHHAVKLPSAQHMDMQMRHFLMAVLAKIGEQTVARIDQPGIARDCTYRADEPGDFCIRCLGAEIIP